MTWIEHSLFKCPVIYITDSADLQSQNSESKTSGKHQIISNPPGGWRNKFHPNQCWAHFLSTLQVKLCVSSETQKKNWRAKPKCTSDDQKQPPLCKKVFWKRPKACNDLKKEILLTGQISLPNYYYFLRYWVICVL